MTLAGKLLSAGCILLVAGALASAETAPRKSTHMAPASKSKTTASSGKTSRKGKKSRKAGWRRGQQKIDTPRAREIQAALIRQHYMEGDPTGTWDAASQRAMESYQADNGWQTKTIPDSRALIKLGLGPSHDHLLNPESAMTMPQAPATETRKTSGPPQK